MSRKRVFKKLVMRGKKFPAIQVEFRNLNDQQVYFDLFCASSELDLTQTMLARRILKNWAWAYKKNPEYAKLFIGIHENKDLLEIPEKP